MKKLVTILTLGIFLAWQGVGQASSTVDALIQKLTEKGILTDKEATQLKGQIAYEEQTSTETVAKKQVPDWVQNLKISGDFRLRDQLQVRKVPGGTSTAGGANFDQNRVRMRARLNLEDQINDKVKVGITLATEGGKDGNGSSSALANGRSNNVTLGGNGGTNSGSFAKPYVAIDKAYATYTPNQDITITGGKMANPIWEPASLLMDPDLTPEGGVIQVQHKLSEMITPFANNAIYILKDTTPSSSATSTKTDPFMFVSQEGIKGNLTDQVYYKAAGSYINVHNPNHTILDNSLTTASPAVGNTLRFNGTYAYNYDLIGGAVELGMNDPFGELLPSPIYIPQIGVFGQYFENVHPSQQNAAWMMGGYMGNSAINGWGTWKIQSFYKVLERDSWLDVFPDDDFYSGYTDTKGWRTQLDLGLAKNLWFTMSYFRTDVFKDYGKYTGVGTAPFSASAPENLFQMDLNFKF